MKNCAILGLLILTFIGCSKMKFKKRVCTDEFESNFINKNYNCDTNVVFAVPNVFTPNGDGMNDLFFITTPCAKSSNIKIYDGKKEIFSSDDLPSVWDGNNNGEIKSGNYKFELNVTAIDGGSIFLEGTVSCLGDDMDISKVKKCGHCITPSHSMAMDPSLNCY